MKWFAIAVALAACAKKAEPPPAEPPVPAMTAAEVQRSQDACKAYVDKACACAEKQPDAKQTCDLARALPDAVRIGLEVAASPDSTRRDVIQAQDSVRKAVKECIEQTMKLPCP